MFDWSQIIDAKAAEEIYGKKPGTIRKAISSGKFNVDVDCKKFGTTWIITIDALEREYNANKKA